MFNPICLRSNERWLNGINSVVGRRHTCCTLGLHFISTWKRARERESGRKADSLSSLPLSLWLCVYSFVCVCLCVCVYFYPYGSSEKIWDDAFITQKRENDPDLGLNILNYLNFLTNSTDSTFRLGFGTWRIIYFLYLLLLLAVFSHDPGSIMCTQPTEWPHHMHWNAQYVQ